MEAARWLIALEDDPEDADLRARIEAWRSTDPANDAAWRDTVHVHGLMAETGPVHALPRQAGTSGVRHDPRQPLRHRLATGVLAAIAAGLLLLFAPSLVVRLQSDQLTATAEVRSVTLDDGSVVMLGADSAIAVRYQDSRRDVRLLKGEAFFQVTPDARRPFRVAARDVEVTVLGTSFNVRLAGDGAEVTVATGVVQVANAGESPAVLLQLLPGDWARLRKAGAVERGAVQADEVAPWLHGQIVARDRPMADVVDELRRYYSGMIVVADDSLRGRRVTGVYNLSDPKAALGAIVGAHGGSVWQVSPWMLVARGD
jgi:transmembrane sensor